MPSHTVVSAKAAAVFSLMLAALLLLQSLVFVGFQASDDANYLSGAFGWLKHTFYIGNSHWTLRHTLTLPTALSVSSLGLTPLSVSLPALLYFIGFLAVQVWALHRYFGLAVAAAFGMLVIFMPGMVVNSTYLAPDVSELFFVGSTFWLVVSLCEKAASGGRTLRWGWLAVGLLAGLAWLNRQTSIAPVLACALFAWSTSRGRSRAGVAWALLGFLAVVGGEWAYLTAMTGEPLYRLRTDFHHDPVDRFAEVSRLRQMGGWIDKEGNLSVNVFVDPILALVISQKYGLIFWTAVAASWRLLRVGAGAHGKLLKGLLLLGALSYVFVAANPKLYLVPRYLIVAAWVAAALTAWWIVELWRQGRTRVAAVVVAVLLLAQWAGLALENTRPRAVEQALVEWVRTHHNQTVYTDIETAARASYFFAFAGVSNDKVMSEAPPPGALFFHSADRVEQCARQPRCRAQAAAFRPTPAWAAIERIEGPLKPLGHLLERLPISGWAPPDIHRRMVSPSFVVTVYRVN
ncbi:MAG: ArnT family glycosyltransferase [Roseateles sp.]|uniref:ArnT family glycosyltransferase n=1 Tax=Roseateles sp. TaxID=1971397 RepID=UPI004035F660